MLEDPIPLLKRQLADAVLSSVADRHWALGARLLGLDLARMCHLRKGRIERFSVERLIRMLARMDRRVDVSVVSESVPGRRLRCHTVADGTIDRFVKRPMTKPRGTGSALGEDS